MNRKLRFTAIFLSALLSGYAQKNQGAPNFGRSGSSCILDPKRNAHHRRRFPPFAEADTIKLVSFRYHRNKYPIKGEQVFYDSLIENRSLSPAGIDSLSAIAFNFHQRKSTGIGSINMCFFPRNAILFVNKSGKLTGCILFCFHCGRDEWVDSPYLSMFSNCDEKLEMVRRFFQDEGIQFGTDRNQNNFPGEEADEEINQPR